MNKSWRVLLAVSLGLLGLLVVGGQLLFGAGRNGFAAARPEGDMQLILVDDFEAQPLMGETFWFYNRMGSDRGQIDGWWDPGCSCTRSGGGTLQWGRGTVTATITQTQGSEAWVGVWTGLNHVIAENIPLDFATIFPAQIVPAQQGNVTGLRLNIVDGAGQLQVELQAPDLSIVWSQTIALSGGAQIVEFNNLPSVDVRNLNWLVKGEAGDFVVADEVELLVQVPPSSPPEQAFLWSYSMLLANWDASSGLTRDRAGFPAGDFDNVSASGLQAAAAVQAWELGMIAEPAARQIVSRTTTALLALPDCHGLWPHFVTNGQITSGTEWSSVDTMIAMLALVEANQAVGLVSGAEAVAQAWQDIEWDLLITPANQISHGFDFYCTAPLTSTWYDFGTETWLANFGYGAATGNFADMDTIPPTFNGSGFIDELAWLFVPAPDEDRWGIEWNVYRHEAVDGQIAYYTQPPHPCYALDLFGLSAAEVPDPSSVPPADIYQPFGVGGEIPPNDGEDLLGHAVLIPHYPAMVAMLRPPEAMTYWTWLASDGSFTPLNNVESLMVVDEPACTHIIWNSLKGSWNLGLQTLGWGNFLLRDDNPLYQAMWDSEFLRNAYFQVCRQDCRSYLPVVVD